MTFSLLSPLQFAGGAQLNDADAEVSSGSFFTPSATPEVFFPSLDSPDPIQADPSPPAQADDEAIAEGRSPSNDSTPAQQTPPTKNAAPPQKRDQDCEEEMAHAREYRRTHKAAIAARRRMHYQNHRDEIVAYSRKYRQLHRTETRAYAKAYRKGHKEEILAANRIYSQTHKVEISAQKRVYLATHKDEIMARRRRLHQVRAADGGKNVCLSEEPPLT